MSTSLKIDFISDISCPWCIIGLLNLEEALVRVGDVADADIHFQPFELNSALPAGGRNIVEYVAERYGVSPKQSAANRDMIRARAAEVGFTMAGTEQSRIYNTFDAHRLLHWAALEGRQAALKHALFEAYFTHEQDPSDRAVLIDMAEKAGLDRGQARDVLTSGRYEKDVRNAQRLWQSRGISSVPAIVINDRHLISGGQSAETFEQALRNILAQA